MSLGAPNVNFTLSLLKPRDWCLLAFVILCPLNTFAQVRPDSVYIEYFDSGSKKVETAFYKGKRLVAKEYKEDNSLKEAVYFGKKGDPAEKSTWSN